MASGARFGGRRCCQCTSGSCCRCSCVNAGEPCLNCYPSRKGRCLNIGAQDSEDTDEDGTGLGTGTGTGTGTFVASASDGALEQLSSRESHSDDTDAGHLPPFDNAAESRFCWGEQGHNECSSLIDKSYTLVMRWRPNLFRLPMGRVGKLFVSEMARLYLAFASSSGLESIALKAACLMPGLLLQNSHHGSKVKTKVAQILEDRLTKWKEGKFKDLLDEGLAIQSRLSKRRSVKQQQDEDGSISRRFSKLMFQGKVESAIRLLGQKPGGRVLHLSDMVAGQDKSVRDVLNEKHPVRARFDLDSAIRDSPPPPVHPVVFDRLDAATIRRVVRNTKGAAGPSGLDAYCWRRMCTSFKEASNSLCHALALSARRLCTGYIDPVIIAPLMASRLIALDKSPGVRPIGIGNTSRRIIAKSILSVLKYDIIDAAGVNQLCVGQIAGVEAAVHSVRKLFESAEAVLFVDASNAFNSLNRSTAMYNLQFICPALATPLINCYRDDSDLFVDGDVLQSQEGVTQGDPLSMSFYALATIPLINELRERCDVRQIWYADDATAVGSVSALRDWWDVLNSRGPGFGYHPNACKTWLVTKEGSLTLAREMFEGTQVQITDQGRPHLGSPIGTDMFIDQFAGEKVDKWLDELKTLAKIASTQPHAAYACLTHGLHGKWMYFLRTTPPSLIQDHVARLECCISSIVIPAITGRPPPNKKVRKIMALPVQLGGLGIRDLMDQAPGEYEASVKLCSSIIGNIESGNQSMDYDCEVSQMEARSDIKAERWRIAKQRQNELMDSLDGMDRRSMELASEKGASSWLSVLPLSEYGYVLHKRAFFDALALRYGWQPIDLPVRCECGASFSVDHALSCKKGGFPALRHNDLRDFTANLLTTVCHEVCVEPSLQPLTGEVLSHSSANSADEARLDISVNGFWGGRYEKSFLDVRVFNPYAPSNRTQKIESCYNKHEKEKKRCYEERVTEIEHASFTPLVFSVTGGMARESSLFYKRLASMISEKEGASYGETLNWIRCSIGFKLLHSSIQSLRGSRSSHYAPSRRGSEPVDLIVAETRLGSEESY